MVDDTHTILRSVGGVSQCACVYCLDTARLPSSRSPHTHPTLAPSPTNKTKNTPSQRPPPPSPQQVLEELAISLKHNLVSKLPFCAFNGGNDVFVDVGNKSLGLDALMRYLDAYPYEVSEGERESEGVRH